MKPLAALMVLWAVPLFAADTKVELAEATYRDVFKAIEAEKGKVVVVDVWADYCLPCKTRFPHIVKLAKDKKADGLAVISITIDDIEDKPLAEKFLKAQGAAFPNFLLNDKDGEKEGEKTLRTQGVPVLHLFGRDGKKVKTFTGETKVEEIDAAVEAELKKK